MDVKEIEKINISNALKVGPSSSLSEILRRLNIEELLSIASEWGIKSRFRTKKEKIIPKLLKYSLDRKRIENALIITEPDEYDLFLKLVSKEYIQNNNLEYKTYQYLMGEGIIFSFYDENRVFFTVPDEIKEIYSNIDKKCFDKMHNRYILVYKYISALNNLYGVFKREKLIEIFNCQNDEKLTIEEFTAIYNKFLSRQQIFYYYNEYIINDYFEYDDFHKVELLLEKTANIPYHIPDKNDISKYADDSYFEMTPQLMVLKDYIINNMCSNEELIGYLVDDIELLCSMEEPIQNIIYEFERRNIFFKNMDQLNYIMPLIADVHNNVRTWSNRGHTYTEIYKITGRFIPKRFHEPVEVLINNKPVIQRVSRNDACICGSGKKFKKCCGN